MGGVIDIKTDETQIIDILSYPTLEINGDIADIKSIQFKN